MKTQQPIDPGPTCVYCAVSIDGARQAREYVPGLWHCRQCKFSLIQSNLNANDGTVTARDTKGDTCPNCSLPLSRVTWKEHAFDLAKQGEAMFERWQAAVKAAPRAAQPDAGEPVAVHWQVRLKGTVHWVNCGKDVHDGVGDDFECRELYPSVPAPQVAQTAEGEREEWYACPMSYDGVDAGDDDWIIAVKGQGCVARELDKADALHIVALHNAPPHSPIADSGDEFGFAVMEHLGPDALTGGKVSPYEAFRRGWCAALTAQPKDSGVEG